MDRPKWTDVAIVILTVGIVFLATMQWWEMHSGGVDTHDLAVAAGKQADAAKALAEQAKAQTDKMRESLGKTDDLIRQAAAQATATNELAGTAGKQAELTAQSVADNKTSSYRELRPYVHVTRFDFTGDLFKGELIKGKASIINSGRTPAVNVNGCGDITLKPNADPITDDFPCPAPNNLKNPDTGEHSQFVLGSNAPGFSIDSPGTSIAVTNASSEVFRQMLSNGALRIYFYGYIEYSDITDTKTVHHTTFCGRYNSGTGLFDICEKHNRMD